MARILVNLLSYTGRKGGMERYTRELYAQLGRMDTDHEFVAYASNEVVAAGAPWFPGELIASGISGENRFAWARGELVASSRAARDSRADLLHNPATLGPLSTSMPAVTTVHDLLYHRYPEYMPHRAYNVPVRWMVGRAVANSAWIMADSQQTKDDIVHYLGYPEDRIDVVHLAGTPSTDVAQPTARREDDLFLAVGARIGHKNWGAIIRALPHIPADRRPRVVITGARGPDPLQRIVDETGMHAWVDLRSWVPDDEISWLYAHATALVVPGLHEGSCLPGLEAMHLGLPVLMSAIPVFREIAGDAAIYFDPLDPRSLAEAMMRAMDHPEERERIAALGLARTREFTWERTARESLAAFDKALGIAS